MHNSVYNYFYILKKKYGIKVTTKIINQIAHRWHSSSLFWGGLNKPIFPTFLHDELLLKENGKKKIPILTTYPQNMV